MGHVEAGGHNDEVPSSAGAHKLCRDSSADERTVPSEAVRGRWENRPAEERTAEWRSNFTAKRLQIIHELSLLEKEEFDLCSEECKSETQCYQILQKTSKQHVQLAQNEMATDDIYVKDKLDYNDAVDI